MSNNKDLYMNVATTKRKRSH